MRYIRDSKDFWIRQERAGPELWNQIFFFFFFFFFFPFSKNIVANENACSTSRDIVPPASSEQSKMKP